MHTRFQTDLMHLCNQLVGWFGFFVSGSTILGRIKMECIRKCPKSQCVGEFNVTECIRLESSVNT